MSSFEPAALPTWLADEIPYGRRNVLVSDEGVTRHIHFIDQGPRTAPAVLFLHGNPTWSFIWRRVIAELPRLRCVAPDLLGFGLSSHLPAPADHTVDRHVDALAQVVEALDLDDFILVGQDWGGALGACLGARLAERHDRRVAGILLANTSVLVPAVPHATAFHRMANTPIVSDLLFRGLGFPLGSLARTQANPHSIAGDVARAYRYPFRRLRDRAGPLGLARLVPNAPGHPSIGPLGIGEAWIRAFAGPMSLVWGTRDPILGRALDRHIRAFPQAVVIRRPDAGHFLQEEIPEALANAVDDLVRRSRAS